MRSAYDFRTGGPLTEMAIVDTFTKLIFGEEEGFSPSEELIIDAFRKVDTNVALDSRKDMGEYLRALGVAEMIELVSQVQVCLEDGLRVMLGAGKEPLHEQLANVRRG